MFDPKYHISQTIEPYWNKTIHFLPHLIIFLLSVIITAIIRAIVINWFSKRKEKQKGKKAFRVLWQSSKKLKYEDLSGRKEIKEKHPSTQAHLQGAVDTLLKTNKNILITSNSGAGKTHFTTNYIRRLNKAYILIPNADDFDKNYDFIPKPPKKARYKIILLDDFYAFFSTGILRLPSFIEHAIRDGYTIWANTITGDEFQIIQNNMPPKLLSQFSELCIQANLGKEEAKRIAKAEGIEKLPDSFGGNIGDIFQDLNVQKARYKSLDEISRLLLIVIKQLYMVGIYHPPFKMLKEDVRKLVKLYEPEISGETITLRLNVLRTKEFIRESKDLLAINFEENYLKTVVEPEMKVKNFMTELSRIFPLNAAALTQAMQTATSYEDSVKIYHSMLENNIQPNVRPFSVLIRKAGDSDIGLTWLTEMDKFKLEPDEYTLNALLRTTKSDTEKMERVKSEMQKRGMSVVQPIADMFAARKIQSNIAAYSNLMNISGDFEKGMELLEQMKKDGVKPDASVYGTLINLSKDVDKGMELLNQMKKEGVKPDASVYGTLINLSKDVDKGMELLNQMKKEGIKSNSLVYGTLINLSDDFDKGKEFFNQMIEDGFKPNVEIYGTLINSSKDFDKGIELLNQMKNVGVKPSAFTYGTLIKLSKDFNKGKKLIDQMIEEGLKPNIEIYGTLINLSDDFDKGKELFDKAIENGLKPNNEIYGTLINCSKDFDKGMELLNQMKNVGVKPSVFTYGTLIKLSNDVDKGMKLLNQMKNEGIKADNSIYGTLIFISKNFNKGKELIDQMIKDGIRPELRTYATLIYLSKDYNDGKAMLDQMIKNGIKPNVRIYTKLIQLSNDPEKGWKLLDEMNSREIIPNVWTYNALIWLYKDNYQIARAILDEAMTDAKVKPNVVTYTELMNISRNYKIASALLEEMVENGIQPNDRTFQVLKALKN